MFAGESDLVADADTIRNRSGRALWWIIAVSLAIHVFFLIANRTFLSEWRWENEPVHACVEFSGAIVAFIVAIILISLQSRKQGTSFNTWIAGALIGMGLLDGMHAGVFVGQSFVWLHSTATLVGGALFALVWLPTSWAKAVGSWWHWAVFSAVFVFGAISIWMPHWFPEMVVDKEFTLAARGMNIAGGLLLFAAAFRLVQSYMRTRNVDDLLFCLHCFLFGSAAIMFEQSQLWDAAWWGWHLLRLLAYAVALWFVVLTEQSTQRTLLRTSNELMQLNATLERRVAERTEELTRQTAELAKEQYLLNSLVENIPDPVFFKDKESRFLRVNRIMAIDTGLSSPEELIGKTDADVWSNAEFCQATLKDEQWIMRTGESIINQEETVVSRDGQSRCVLVTKMPLLNEAGEIIGTFGIARDITDRKQSELALSRLNDELARSNQDLEQFAYVASHDLSEPLRAVVGFTDLLNLQYGEQLDETAKSYMEHAAGGAKRMQLMIRSLLDYSRVGTRKQPKQLIELSETVDSALLNLQSAIEESNATITKGDLPKVAADRSQMIRLFQNLISNALKFRGPEAPRITVDSEPADDGVCISITDNGIGIEPKYRQQIFEIFKRLHGRREYPGTGIGLAICQKIVARHGGRIWVESTSDEGSRFCFTIANVEEDAEAETQD